MKAKPQKKRWLVFVTLINCNELRGWGKLTIRVSTEGIVSISTRVRDTIRLSTWLTPDESIHQSVARRASWSNTETSTVDVTPVTPLETETLDGVASGINDGVVGHAGRLEEGSEGLDVSLLVLALVVLSVRGAGEFSWGGGKCIPAGDVGCEAEYLLWGASGLVDLGDSFGSRLWLFVSRRSGRVELGRTEVGIPSEPSSVASIDVHGDVWKIECLQSVRNTIFVTSF